MYIGNTIVLIPSELISMSYHVKMLYVIQVGQGGPSDELFSKKLIG